MEIYRSELLEPGDSLVEIALSEPLTAGTHEAAVSYTHLDVYKRQIYDIIVEDMERQSHGLQG